MEKLINIFESIISYGFEGNSDFRTITQKRVIVQGNMTSYIDYEITLDMLTISSREVAEMMDMRHADFLRKVETFNKIFNERKIALVDF